VARCALTGASFHVVNPDLTPARLPPTRRCRGCILRRYKRVAFFVAVGPLVALDKSLKRVGIIKVSAFQERDSGDQKIQCNVTQEVSL
jgi:hypothetical protein